MFQASGDLQGGSLVAFVCLPACCVESLFAEEIATNTQEHTNTRVHIECTSMHTPMWILNVDTRIVRHFNKSQLILKSKIDWNIISYLEKKITWEPAQMLAILASPELLNYIKLCK